MQYKTGDFASAKIDTRYKYSISVQDCLLHYSKSLHRLPMKYFWKMF